MMIDKSKTRRKDIDFMRFLGLSLIILAHCQPPQFIFQLRNFDVPLMFFVSGSSLLLSGAVYKKNLLPYITDRFKRLIIPTWITLFILFAIIMPFNGVDLVTDDMQSKILSSFSMAWGIGFVWVIRLFFLVSVAGFIVCRATRRLSTNLTMALSLLIMVVYQLFLRNPEGYGGVCTDVREGYCSVYILECIPYLCFFIMGFIYKDISYKKLFLFSLLGVFLFSYHSISLYADNNKFINSNVDKYPAGVYYISYALVIIPVLIALSRVVAIPINQSGVSGFLFSFISTNSLWIYLWHVNVLMSGLFSGLSWYNEFIMIYLSATVITLIQTTVVRRVAKNIANEKTRKNLLAIMTG